PQVRVDLALAVGVVAEGDRVHAGSEQALGDAAGDADAVGRVLTVGDDEVEAELLAQPGQPLLDDAPSGRREDVGDEEDPHRGCRAYRIGLAPADGPSDMATWLPASDVYCATVWSSTLERSTIVPSAVRAAVTWSPTCTGLSLSGWSACRVMVTA